MAGWENPEHPCLGAELRWEGSLHPPTWRQCHPRKVCSSHSCSSRASSLGNFSDLKNSKEITRLALKIIIRNKCNKRLSFCFCFFFLLCPVRTTPLPLTSASHIANAPSLFPPTTNPNRRPLVFFSKREIPFTSPSSRWERLCAGSEDTGRSGSVCQGCISRGTCSPEQPPASLSLVAASSVF